METSVIKSDNLKEYEPGVVLLYIKYQKTENNTRRDTTKHSLSFETIFVACFFYPNTNKMTLLMPL